jgi:hypothetical protein
MESTLWLLRTSNRGRQVHGYSDGCQLLKHFDAWFQSCCTTLTKRWGEKGGQSTYITGVRLEARFLGCVKIEVVGYQLSQEAAVT